MLIAAEQEEAREGHTASRQLHLEERVEVVQAGRYEEPEAGNETGAEADELEDIVQLGEHIGGEQTHHPAGDVQRVETIYPPQ
jgi:hypothetical protein